MATEGSQHLIEESLISKTSLSMKDLPGDYFRLKINLNDTFSRDKHPNNNCYNFTIEFPSASAEAIQNHISQCNRYQITHVRLPIRTYIGIAMTFKPPPYIYPVLRTKPLTNADTTTTGIFKAKSGVASQVGYKNVHEELCDLHILITCATFSHDLSAINVRIFPNDSQTTYDKHQLDIPAGLETDLTIMFYKENDHIHND